MMRGVNETYASNRSPIRDYATVLIVITLVTLGGWFAPLSYNALGCIYLLASVALSVRVGRSPALVGAVLSSVAWDFFFVPPRLSFSVLHFDESLLLTTYFVVTLIGSQLSVLRAAADRAKILAESELMHQAVLDSVSHELKTPLAVLRSAVEQLGTSDPLKRERLLTEVEMGLHRLDNLVGNLLNQTRLESGVLKPKMDWCDGRDLVAAARRTVGARIGDHPLTVEIPHDFPIFRADAALMEQAIANLLLNAAVHTPAAGRVRVGAGVSEDSNRVFIMVADEGPGIAPHVRARIFDKFNGGTSPRVGGLGLGLSIVRGFMHAQGGDVSVDSTPEGGARFTLFLPLSTLSPAMSE